jgi:hypothetical protein
VERELTGRESEPWEIIYFKLYKTQIPVVEQAIETAALMLGTDKSRGYCLEIKNYYDMFHVRISPQNPIGPPSPPLRKGGFPRLQSLRTVNPRRA